MKIADVNYKNNNETSSEKLPVLPRNLWLQYRIQQSDTKNKTTFKRLTKTVKKLYRFLLDQVQRSLTTSMPTIRFR